MFSKEALKVLVTSQRNQPQIFNVGGLYIDENDCWYLHSIAIQGSCEKACLRCRRAPAKILTLPDLDAQVTA